VVDYTEEARRMAGALTEAGDASGRGWIIAIDAIDNVSPDARYVARPSRSWRLGDKLTTERRESALAKKSLSPEQRLRIPSPCAGKWHSALVYCRRCRS